ncbi:MAG: hypothetical protein IJ306_08455 [Oscillospiraceae bacterium]|nr:hypothetical protein [Oscillospiraceae bacterium]
MEYLIFEEILSGREEKAMEHEVLIGTVKNKNQFEVNFSEKFYHIPEAVVPKNMLPVEYIALYLPSGTFGDGEGCIEYYGKVAETKLVKRGEIEFIPSRNPDMTYYKFEVEEWQKLDSPIIRECGGIYAKAFTSLEKLLSAKKLSDIVNTERAVAKKIRNRGFSEEELEKIEITKDPVGVKLLAKRINKAAGREKVTPVQISKYLLEKGYLEMAFDEKTKTENRVPTEKGSALGIENFWEINRFYREYSKNYYSEAAQKFVIEHLNEIIMITLDEAYKND